MWRGKHKGQVVAAKTSTVTETDRKDIGGVGGAQLVALSNGLTASHTAVLQGGHDMEDILPSERVAPVRRDDDRKSASVRDSIEVDGEWEYQRVPEGASRCQSAEACTFLVQGPHPHLTPTLTRSL